LTISAFWGDSAEHRYRLEPVEKATPESLSERGWALALLDGVPFSEGWKEENMDHQKLCQN
jgi:hypothetical protein